MKKINLKKIIFPLVMLMIIFAFPFAVTSIFLKVQDKFYSQVLKNNLGRLDELSKKIVKTIHLEINYSIHMLETVVELSGVDNEALSLEEKLNILKKIENKGHFTSFGIVNINGEIVETDGTHQKLNKDKLIKNFSKLKKDGYFVSDVLIDDVQEELEEILIALPLYKDEKINGVIFGHYPIADVVERLLLSDDNQQYFQIVDTNGKYINRSENKNSLAIDADNFWLDLEKYTYPNKNTPEEVRENLMNHKKGNFYFEFENQGRFVTYEPLGVNNWYIFSILTKEKLNLRVTQIQNISKDLLVYLTGVNILLIISILSLGVYIYLISELLTTLRSGSFLGSN